MPQKLVECIPNFSDARRPEVVQAIAEAIAAVRGVRILDRHSDLDHNRSVITFVGAPAAVEEAAFQGIRTAAELINLDEHQGEHPRIGAADVVPFVPISGVDMAECVQMAQRLGARVGSELGIPVYLYEEAAARPERQNLENIRRGQYEALKAEIGVKPERQPDFGPTKVGPAGAVVIGARQPLIAFNVYLTTDEVSIAKKIAKAVRHSSGGLRYVKGLGLLVEGRAQVSMNLTNFRGTPLATVVEFIRREAARYGVGIHHSELVGLIPQGALVDAAVWYTQMDQFEPEQVLESRLYAEESAQTDFIEALAAGTPTPGGGSASAYAAAMAAALAGMVARLTVGKKKYAPVEGRMVEIAAEADELRTALREAVELDAQAFEQLMAAYRLPKEAAERPAAIRTATLHAAQVPLEVIRKSVRVLELAAEALEHGNLNALSDAAVGTVLAQAAVYGAGLNVRTNLSGLGDESASAALLAELQTLETRMAGLMAQVRQVLSERGGFTLP